MSSNYDQLFASLGVKNVNSTTDTYVQAGALYGVRIDTSQPKYGVVMPGGQDISITSSKLDEIIDNLTRTINTLTSSWSDQTKRNISIIENSWIGPDCKAYTNKLNAMNTKVENAITALILLRSTYIKARELVKNNQKANFDLIEGIR